MIHAVAHVHHIQQFFGPLGSQPGRNTGVHHGQFYVFQGVGSGNQIEVLEHEANLPVSDGGKLPVVGQFHIGAIQTVVSLCGLVQHTDQVHQGGLTGAGCADDGDKFSLIYVQINAVEDFQFVGLTNIEPLDDAAHLNQLVHSMAPPIMADNRSERRPVPAVTVCPNRWR